MGEYVFAFYWLFSLPALLLLFSIYFGRNKFYDNDKDALPRPYPLLGHLVAILRNRNQNIVEWMCEVVNKSPSSTFFLHLPLRRHPHILTSNPANVQHILKTRFGIYHKHRKFGVVLHDMCRENVFLADGQRWRKLRQWASHEFNSRPFHKFANFVVPENEISNRLLPLLSEAAANNTVVDLGDILRRFTFDTAVQMALGHDLAYLSNSPKFPPTHFADAFESAFEISMKRIFSFFWKAKRFFNMGSERRLKRDISEIRGFIREIIISRRKVTSSSSSSGTDHHHYHASDFLSGLMNDPEGKFDDDEFLIDSSINFLLGAQDTVITALTWYFWSVLKNPDVEDRIVIEVKEKKSSNIRDMIYTHASICESLRLHPPVPFGGREATEDDVLPDGTKVKKGMAVFYHTYAMGRSLELWGSDWPEFRPERWLKRSDENGREWTFVARDSFTYPVFHGGPRICLGKEIAFTHIKSVVAAVLGRFHFVLAPVVEEHPEPVFFSNSTSKMTNGFLVKVVDRM
ncbi:PREDICTED: cytochrome P450 94A1-like [Nicotiana attenuata]|uniref:Cytochrome p450 94b1 n=1 Tax=Nicotiana attenuata TaxID=49451 RepID=A0A1J6KDJ0_NICAT|nr:PREDICTED: cytochrome P450 94A1-like [Nicotiana attenuata]OIT22992.1 cytochrome p450 94b1 [Nicotiana attenuata]